MHAHGLCRLPSREVQYAVGTTHRMVLEKGMDADGRKFGGSLGSNLLECSWQHDCDYEHRREPNRGIKST